MQNVTIIVQTVSIWIKIYFPVMSMSTTGKTMIVIRMISHINLHKLKMKFWSKISHRTLIILTHNMGWKTRKGYTSRQPIKKEIIITLTITKPTKISNSHRIAMNTIQSKDLITWIRNLVLYQGEIPNIMTIITILLVIIIEILAKNQGNSRK